MALKAWQNYDAIFTALSSGDDVLLRDVSNLGDNATHGSIKRVTLDRLLAFSPLTPGGRLTLETGVPVSTTNQTAKSVLYYTPYVHDWVRLYTDTGLKIYNFTERSLTLTGLTSDKNYDIFLYDNAGTLTLEPSAAWTTNTTRADALTWQAGIGWVKSGAATRLWLGTIRTTGTTTTELVFGGADTAARAFVWNAYNRVRGCFHWHDTTDQWTYTVGTWRQRRASSNNQMGLVVGAVGQVIIASSACISYNASATTEIAFGYDSTSAKADGCITGRLPDGGNAARSTFTELGCAVGLGYHYIAELEMCSAALGTGNFYGDVGFPNNHRSGAVVSWEY